MIVEFCLKVHFVSGQMSSAIGHLACLGLDRADSRSDEILLYSK